MEEARYKPAAMQSDGVIGSGKPPPLILERFREMVREREEELRVTEDVDSDVVLGGDDVVRLYEILLSELTFNSKPIITDLTIIAGEQRMHGAGIADAICARIIEAPVDQKLPSLYLLDSIVKNIGKEYIKYFSARLPEVFCEAYEQVRPNVHPAMVHLFGTWSSVFPPSVLQRIESHLQLTPSVSHRSSSLPPSRASESPRPTYGIHVNLKYLEARRQFGQATSDDKFRSSRRSLTTSKILPQRPPFNYEEFNSDDVEINTVQAGSARLTSSIRAGPTSSGLDALKLPPSFGVRMVRSPSPYGAGHARLSSPSVEEFVDNSPRRGASPLNSGRDYGISRVMGTDDRTIDWTKKQIRHSAAVRYNNGVDLDRPRALIDAYGIDKRKDPVFEGLDVNGIHGSGATKTWQNSEEEEFNWEHMSPTLADHGSNKDMFSSSLPSTGSFKKKPALAIHDAAPLEPLLRRDWPNQPQFPVVNGSSMVEESNHGVNNTIYGLHNESTHSQGSRKPPVSWKLAQNVDHSSVHHFNANKGGHRMPFPGSGILPSAGEKPSLIGNFLDANAQNQGPSFVSRGASASLDHVTPESQIAPGPSSAGAWSSAHLHSSHVRPLLPPFQPNRLARGQLDTWSANNLVANQNADNSAFSEQFLGSTERKSQNFPLPQFLGHQSGQIHMNQQSLGQTASLARQSHMSQDQRHHVAHPASAAGTSPLLAPQLYRGYAPPGHIASGGAILPSPSGLQTMPNSNVPNAYMHLPGVSLPLQRGPSPGTSQMLPVFQPPSAAPSPSAGGDYSSLFSSLMAQGLISLTNQTPAQDLVGLEFNADLLKVRHESAITALYSDLPRQCTTCGLRFKQQEAHSSHMDWHVTRNRISKNRKQKPSRKWFVSVNMWLTGAEALGTDAVPSFLPSENILEKKDDEELAVPADDDQKVCALCGEPFDDFYCDETDEWMYKGAVYMNAPSGSTAEMDRSMLGPIVHSKCRPETGGSSS